MVQAQGRGSHCAAQTKDYGANHVNSGVTVFLSQPSRQEDSAPQHQQPDYHQPSRLGHVHVEMPGHGGNGQGDGHAGQLDQKLSGSQSYHGLAALLVCSQLTESGDYIQPPEYYTQQILDTS